MQRPRSLDQLLDATVLDIPVSNKPWSLTDFHPKSEDPWQKILSSAKEAITQSNAKPLPADKRAQMLTMTQQLYTLNSLSDAERKNLLQALLESEHQIAALEKSLEKVHEVMRYGLVREAIEKQHEVVSAADAISRKAILFEFDSLDKARKKNRDPAIDQTLSDELDDICATMSAPMIERVRLSALLNFNKNVYQAEKMLDEAMRTVLPSEAMQSAYVKELKGNAIERLAQLRVENHLLEVYDKNSGKLVISPKEKVISEDALKAAKAKSGDEDFRVLTEFLSNNFRYLTRKHWLFFGKSGITRADILDYVKERSKDINDLNL
jgi:hypothetical protein